MHQINCTHPRKLMNLLLLNCRAFICPKKRFPSRTKIHKCCPFGEELDLVPGGGGGDNKKRRRHSRDGVDDDEEHDGGGGGTGQSNIVRCVKAVTDAKKEWKLRMNGYIYDLQVRTRTMIPVIIVDTQSTYS